MSHSVYDSVAELYDAFVQTQFDISFWLKEVQQTDGEVLELMAGSGRVTIPLAQAGARITAVDNSPEMLAILRRKLARANLTANVVQMDVYQLDFDRLFNLIFIPFHALAELKTLSAQEQALRAIHRHLTGDGRFIVTLHNPTVRLKTINGQPKSWGKRALDDNQGTLFLWALEQYDPQTQIVTADQFFELFDGNGAMQRRQYSELRFRLTTRDEFQTMAESVGFRVSALYGDYEYADFDDSASPVMIWVLRR
jgi:ubiquinone/menaquinone biosynthesis C-methylase UbiE